MENTFYSANAGIVVSPPTASDKFKQKTFKAAAWNRVHVTI